MKECPQCHAMNEDDVKFCESCGAAFPTTEPDFVTMPDLKKPEVTPEPEKAEDDEWAVASTPEPTPVPEKAAVADDDWSVPSPASAATPPVGGPVYGEVVKPPKKGIPTWVWIVGGVVVLLCLCCVIVTVVGISNGFFEGFTSSYNYGY